MPSRPRQPEPKTRSNAVLWANVQALMRHRYGKENLTRFAADCKIGPGTATRIKEQQTAIGFDVLEKIAASFHLAPWQLLVPDMEPQNPPVVAAPSEAERRLYERVRQAKEALNGFLEHANTKPGDLP